MGARRERVFLDRLFQHGARFGGLLLFEQIDAVLVELVRLGRGCGRLRSAGEAFLDPAEQVREMERFLQVVVGSERLARVVRIAPPAIDRAHQDHGRGARPRAGLQPRAELESVDVREHRVEHDQIVALGAQLLLRLAAVPGEIDHVPRRLQGAVEHPKDVEIVIDREDARRAGAHLDGAEHFFLVVPAHLQLDLGFAQLFELLQLLLRLEHGVGCRSIARSAADLRKDHRESSRGVGPHAPAAPGRFPAVLRVIRGRDRLHQGCRQGGVRRDLLAGDEAQLLQHVEIIGPGADRDMQAAALDR